MPSDQSSLQSVAFLRRREINQPVIRYEPRFIEEAVFVALRDHPQEAVFHEERNRLYEVPDLEDRELSFHRLHRAWFLRLGLAKEIEKALDEQPLVNSNLETCLVLCAPGRKHEGGDLLVKEEAGVKHGQQRTLRLLLRPESLLRPVEILSLLRHELFHISDMLDPHFGYEPNLPAAEAGPTHDRMLLDRYRVLWDTTIEGRMVRRGWAPDTVRLESYKDFGRAFPMFGEKTTEMFSWFFDHESHTHGELVAVSREPRTAINRPDGTPQPGSRCPLCHFPTYEFTSDPKSLPKGIIGRIIADFPRWNPSQGLCYQCTDLYRARTRHESIR